MIQMSQLFKRFLTKPKKAKEPKGKVSHSFNYDYITDGIFIGTNACCIMHFKPELLKKGVDADISLQDDKLDAPYGAKYFCGCR